MLFFVRVLIGVIVMFIGNCWFDLNKELLVWLVDVKKKKFNRIIVFICLCFVGRVVFFKIYIGLICVEIFSKNVNV